MVKLMLMAGALLGTGTVAMENEVVNDVVTGTATQVKQMIQKKLGFVSVEQVKESGYPYPQDVFFEGLSEDQEFTVISTIDQINASYDFSSMTDEEIESAIIEIKAELHDLYDELGIEAPSLQQRVRQGSRKGKSENSTPTVKGDGECDLEPDSV